MVPVAGSYAVVREYNKKVTRSPKWEALEREFRKENPTCAACGKDSVLQVHHVKPFHLHPELELDKSNLITLCMGKSECHLAIGHGGTFKAANLTVREDSAIVLSNPIEMPMIINKAKTNRVFVE